MTNNNEENSQNIDVKNKTRQGLDNLEKEFKEKIDLYIEYELQQDLTYFDNEHNINVSFNEFIKSLNDTDKKDFKIFLNDKKTSKIKLKRQILQISTPLVNLLNNVKNTFKRDFSFDNESENTLNDNLKTQKQSDLEHLFYKQISRQKFLKSIGLDDMKLKEEDKKDQKLLDDIFSGNQGLKDEILLNPDLLYSIKKLAFLEPYNVILSDLDIMLEKLDDNGKKLLVEYFIPTISVKDALEYGFLDSEKKASEIIKDQVKYKFNLSGDELDEIVSKLDKSYFFIQTSNLDNIYKIFDYPKYKLKIIDDINALKDELSQDDKINSFKMFHDMVNDNKNISQNIKNSFTKLINGNYIKISGGKIKNSQYFYINNIENGSEFKTFLFTNITLSTGISKNNKGDLDNRTYESFIKLLEVVSSSKDGTKIEFLTKNELGEIQEIPDEQEINSKLELKKFLDEINPKGKNVPVEKMAFYADSVDTYDKNGKIQRSHGKELFYIKNITNDQVILDTGESFSLSIFANIFKSKKCERFERIDSPSELIEKLSKENDDFKDLIIDDDGKIKPKNEKGNKDYPGITYLIGEKEESYLIDDLGNNSIDFHSGEYKEGNKKDKPDIFIGKQKAKGWGYTEFYNEIKSKKLTPKKDGYVKNNDEENIPSVHRERSLFKSWMGMWSIMEMVSAGNQIFHSIEHSLQTGNKLKSAKFALALGKFLPESVRHSLQSTVEGEEKKTMDELLQHLTTLDSKVMIPEIVEIITNKSSHQYEVEAALAAMYSKYGTLYNKAELSKYRGTFIWYEALGGKVGDALYIETKKNCEEVKAMGNKSTPKPFTEEYLIEQLLSKQANGDLRPKRRSKIHKEMGGYLSQGIKTELEDGASKAGNQITLKGRLDYSINELKNGGFSNGLGAVEKIWSKGGNPEEMHAIPFVITMTGISKYFPEELLIKLTSGMGWGGVYTELMFNKDAVSLAKFQKGMKVIVKSLLGETGLKELNAIGTDVSKAYKFWTENGKKLIGRMIGKDGYIFTMKDKDEDIGNYYNFLSGMQNDDEYNIKKEDIDNGLLSYSKSSPIYTMGKKLAKENITFNQAGRIQPTSGTEIFDTFLEHLKEIKNINYLNDDEKFELFYEIYSTLEPVVRTGFGGWVGGDVMLKSPEVKRLKSYGIDLINNSYNIPENQKPTKDTVFGYTENNDSYKNHVKNAYNNFKNIDFEDSSEGDVSQEKVHVQYSIDEILTPQSI